MWIKICGITTLEDAETAIAAGADAVGFVFAESPRRLRIEDARRIVEQLPQLTEKVGVFVDATPEEIVQTQEAAGLTGVQLHGGGAIDLPELRDRIGDLARILQVVHFDSDAAGFVSQLRRFSGNGHSERYLLVDTCVAGKQGGTGVAFDWAAARAGFLREAGHLRLIAAGGLHPENVRQAIQMLEPWGVDVSSGVEARSGKKDRERVVAFVRAARQAWAELEATAKA